MASQEEFVQAIREAYKELDTNQDGVICKEELQSLMTQMFSKPVPQKVIDEIMNVADQDKSGSINSLDELIAALCSIEIIEICAELRAVFDTLDTDKNGTLTKDEIEKGWSKISSGDKAAEVKALIDRADVDGDGKIDCSEFINFILEEMLGC